MVQCPTCEGPIPAWRLWTLTNFSTTTCRACGSVLRANRPRLSLMGGILGTTWTAIWIWGSRSDWSVPVSLMAVFCLAGGLWAVALFSRLEVVRGPAPEETA